MAHIYRLIRAVFVLLGLVVPGLADAAVCTQYSGYSGFWRDSNLAAMQDWATKNSFCPGCYVVNTWCDSPTSVSCHAQFNTGSTSHVTLWSRTGDYCAEDLCPPLYGTNAGFWRWKGTASVTYVCDQFTSSGLQDKPYCLIKAERDISYKLTDDGEWQSAGPAKYTGFSCAPVANGDGESSTSAPGSGAGNTVPGAPARSGSDCDGYWGEVQGVPTCVAKQELSGISSTPTTSTNTTSTPEGTSTQSITKETKCEAGACTTTTTTTTTSNGTSTVVITTSSKPIGEFCAENPKDKACGGSGGPGLGEGESSFGGSCVADFACSGDAVSCAVALATNKLRCAFEPSQAAREPYGSAVASGTPTLPNSEIEVSNALFDTDNALGVAGAGVQDKTVTVMGSSVTLPLSVINPYLEMLGNLIVAISFLLAIRILIRG